MAKNPKRKIPANYFAPNTTETTPLSPPPEERKEIKSLAELQAECEKTIYVDVDYNRKPFRIPARRLRPSEDAALDDIINSVMPPMIRGKTMEDDRPDFQNPDYIKNRNRVEIEARALGLYWTVPLFADAQPGLTDRKQIVEFVQSKFNAQILSLLWQAIRDGGITLAELVNFT
jgi:hypothetical protein